MSKKFDYLYKNIFLFTISIFGPRLISFFMIRVHTTALTTYEYGIAELIFATTSFLAPILTVCINSGVMRFTIEGDRPFDEVFSSSQYILLRGILAGFILSALATIVLRNQIDGIYIVYAFLYFASFSVYSYFSLMCRGIDRVNVMVEISLMNTITSCTLHIVLLSWAHMGIMGYFIGACAGPFLSALWAAMRTKAYGNLRVSSINKDLVSEIERYCIPLIFNEIGWWVNNSLDKYIVTYFLGVGQNGIYSVSYKIPTILQTVGACFANAWTLSAIKEFDSKDSDGFISKMYRLYFAALTICCSGIMLFNIPLAKIIYSNDFFEAWHYSSPILLATVFVGTAGFFEAIFVAVKDTKVLSVSTVMCGIVNTVVSVFLVQRIGAMGVAIGTLVANVIMWCFRLISSRRYVVFEIPFLKHLTVYSLLILQIFVGMQGWTYSGIVSQCLICVTVIFINKDEVIEIIYHFLKKIRPTA